MSAGKPRAPKQFVDVTAMTEAELADEHRGCTMGKLRYDNRLKDVEAELVRRGLHAAESDRAFVSRQIGDIGKIDIKRLRADLGDNIVKDYALGERFFWRSEAKPA